jgi:Secretion system C-terminal sorting domain
MTQKITLVLFLSTLFFSPVNAQDILWEKTYGGKQADYLMDAHATADYGFILAGSSLSVKSGNKSEGNHGDLDYWVWKMKENGDLDWQKNFGGSGSDFLQSMDLTRDGGFILAGTSNSGIDFDKTEETRGNDDFWILKLDAKGGMEWQKTIGGSSQEKLQSIHQTRDGGYIIGGSSSSDVSGEKTTNSFGNLDYWLLKMDNKGKIVWQKTFGGIYFDELRSVEQTKDGGFIVGGYSNSPISGNKTEDNIGVGDFWVLKLDGNGEIQWQRSIGGDKDDQLYVVHQTYDGNYIVGGNSNSGETDSKKKSNTKGTDFWVLKLQTNGETLWQETYNISEIDILSSLVENKDHTLLLGGYAKSESTPLTPFQSRGGMSQSKDEKEINDYVAIKISENGEELWRKSVGSEGEDLLKKVIETRDGGYLLAGTSNAQIPSPALPSGKRAETGSTISENVFNSNQEINNNGVVPTSGARGINTAIGDVSKDINNGIKDKTDEITKKVNDKLNNENSPFKMGVNSPTGSISLPSLGDGTPSNNSANDTSSKALPLGGLGGNKSTRDQAKTFGSNDFWVVKLKDQAKPNVVKATIEAFPNPAENFTNIIVGYEFTSGTATVFDLGGRLLQTQEITSRTVPIDLSNYPAGIYIVNIDTNIQHDGIKIIKGIDKK